MDLRRLQEIYARFMPMYFPRNSSDRHPPPLAAYRRRNPHLVCTPVCPRLLDRALLYFYNLPGPAWPIVPARRPCVRCGVAEEQLSLMLRPSDIDASGRPERAITISDTPFDPSKSGVTEKPRAVSVSSHGNAEERTSVNNVPDKDQDWSGLLTRR